jgi:hypothetical protein
MVEWPQLLKELGRRRIHAEWNAAASNRFRRIALDHREWWYGLRDNTTGRDYGSVSDGDVWEDDRPGADEGFVLDPYPRPVVLNRSMKVGDDEAPDADRDLPPN